MSERTIAEPFSFWRQFFREETFLITAGTLISPWFWPLFALGYALLVLGWICLIPLLAVYGLPLALIRLLIGKPLRGWTPWEHIRAAVSGMLGFTALGLIIVPLMLIGGVAIAILIAAPFALIVGILIAVGGTRSVGIEVVGASLAAILIALPIVWTCLWLDYRHPNVC